MVRHEHSITCINDGDLRGDFLVEGRELDCVVSCTVFDASRPTGLNGCIGDQCCGLSNKGWVHPEVRVGA